MPNIQARVLILATNGFAELLEPRQALIDAGATVILAAPSREPISGVSGINLTHMEPISIKPDISIDEIDENAFDALFLPGGLGNPDRLRIIQEAVDVVGRFMRAEKLIASICHGPWMLVEAGVVDGRRLTGWRSIRTDLLNAGATVLDEPIVRDGNLLTSRMPEDIPSFSQAFIEALADFQRKTANG